MSEQVSQSEASRGPASRPCGSCPYRRDVSSGVWAPEEYDKLPAYDNDTPYQPPAVFLCHQQNGRMCAGWVGCHDAFHLLGLRMAHLGGFTDEDVRAALDYECPVPLWGSGAEAASHGMAEVQKPSAKARSTINKLERKRERR